MWWLYVRQVGSVKLSRHLSAMQNFKSISETLNFRLSCEVVSCIPSLQFSSSRESRQQQQAKKTQRKDSIVKRQGPKQGGEVTLSEKVVEAGKTTFYSIFVLAGVGAFVIMMYGLWSYQFSSHGETSIRNMTFKLCKNHPQVIEAVGDNIISYGERTSRNRRRHVSSSEYESDGVKHKKMRFYIKGSKREAVIHLDVKLEKGQKPEYRYLVVEPNGYLTSIVIEDNR